MATIFPPDSEINFLQYHISHFISPPHHSQVVEPTKAQMCGVVIEALGWEAVFYVPAAATFLWFLVWQVTHQIEHFMAT